MKDSTVLEYPFCTKPGPVLLLVHVGAGSMPRARHARYGSDQAGVCQAAKPVAGSQVRPLLIVIQRARSIHSALYVYTWLTSRRCCNFTAVLRDLHRDGD